MTGWNSTAAAVLVLATLCGPAAATMRAQATPDERAAPAVSAVTFTTPDGSRFVLLPDAGMPLVHWAIATLAHDPPGFAGLSIATMRSALGGTWSSGSRNADQEQKALADLDAAYHTWLADRGNAAAGAELARLSTLVEQLGDPVLHHRVLASVPMHRPEVIDHPPVCLFVTTTVPDTLDVVAQRLIDRRERTALRDLQGKWVEVVLGRVDRQRQDDRTALRAEVLALAIPDHAFRHELEQPGLAAPQRAVAMATWQAMQRPERTVHVLYGGFDAAAVRAMLERRFEATALPAAEPLPVVVARPISSLRRSVVPGARVPTVALAFVLPPGFDPTVLDVATRWLGGGPDSRLGQELPRLGRQRAQVSCLAPWPPTVGGNSLLLIEVADPNGVDGLAVVLRKALRDVTTTPPTPASLQAALANAQRDWTTTSNDPRQLAAAVAESALLWPQQPPGATRPERVDGTAVQQLLARTFATQPVVVEARP